MSSRGVASHPQTNICSSLVVYSKIHMCEETDAAVLSRKTHQSREAVGTQT